MRSKAIWGGETIDRNGNQIGTETEGTNPFRTRAPGCPWFCKEWLIYIYFSYSFSRRNPLGVNVGYTFLEGKWFSACFSMIMLVHITRNGLRYDDPILVYTDELKPDKKQPISYGIVCVSEVGGVPVWFDPVGRILYPSYGLTTNDLTRRDRIYQYYVNSTARLLYRHYYLFPSEKRNELQGQYYCEHVNHKAVLPVGVYRRGTGNINGYGCWPWLFARMGQK